jgi:AcrR family transcriptional regulator
MPRDRTSALETRTGLLEAAVTCLRETGYARLSTRAVAERAGVPVSQIHYHFGGKDGLLLAVLGHQDRQLLARQRALYGQALPLWQRWQRACDFLEEDLASGYVRVLQELIAAGWSDARIAARVAEELTAWADLLTAVAEEAVAAGLLPGLRARHVAVLVGCAFLGAEEVELLGLGDRLGAVDALRSLGDALRAAEEVRG